MIDINPSQLLPPVPENNDLITFTVKVDGNPVSDQFEITHLMVSRRLNRIPYALIHVLDSDVSARGLEVSDQDLLSPGKEIEILAGYHSDESVLFKGIIIRHNIKIKDGQSAKLEIECKDTAVKMTVGRKNRYFNNISDSDLIKQIINTNYSESIQTDAIEDTQPVHPHMVQYFATDWDFILTRADANAQLVLPKDGQLVIKKPQFDQAEKFVLNYGSSIFEFEAEMDARDQYPAARSVSWDMSQQDLSVAEATPSGAGILGGGGIGGALGAAGNALSGAAGNLVPDLFGTGPNTDYSQVIGISNFLGQHSGAFTNEELQAWAEAQFQKSTLSKSKGRVRFEGVADIYPGDSINLQNVGARHSGKVFVTAVKHEIQEGSWFTEAQFGLPHCWFGDEFDDIQDKPASNLLPGVNGLQIGLVTKIENDPESQDRVLVRLPLVDKNAEGVWARVASQDAGSGDNGGRGAYFRPEVDDEVIVGFVNDDPRNPIILGMLNSSSMPAPITATADNHEKGWITRSGIRMIFNDDLKSLNVETPDGKKLTIDDQNDAIQLEDQHGNTIKMSSDGIEITSGADLKMTAQGDVQIEGMNVSQKANQEISVEGQAKAQLKSVADVVINGTFVKIN